eukprot:CAMPEP_0172631674 /NCGR_PEP_ID=MMETSP1068-20121228/180570_1 /TAXON_ID=35684 /ORGANISM="Pseudopedinella elastica, Strain CCMP716" /LENGTH=155 /DNA_ID=CAMNT_0013442883 /DNA_START=793 /DNA_END=1260 /DNA_ORIENTATION=+
MHGCWCILQRRVVLIWPSESKTLLGIDPASRRFLAHECLFWSKAAILFGVDMLVAGINYNIGVSTGNWSHYKFHYRYATAISQWTVVLLIVFSSFAFAYDIESFPQASGKGPAGRPRWNSTSDEPPLGGSSADKEPSPSFDPEMAPNGNGQGSGN